MEKLQSLLHPDFNSTMNRHIISQNGSRLAERRMGKDEMAAGGRMYIQISQGGTSEAAVTRQYVAMALLMGTECLRFAVLLLLLPVIPEDSYLSLIWFKFL